jgi:LacI family transcriptional regulator
VFLRPYYAEILSGIYSAAHEHAFHIRFIRFFNELRDPVLFNQLIHQEEIYGLLLVATDQCITTTADRQIIEHISRQIERIVCVDWQTEGISSIMFDRHDSARKAVRYLFGKGYGDIVYIGENDERVGGFRQAFIERNAPDGDFNAGTLSISDAMDMSSGYQAIQKLHQVRGSLPRAITAGSDEVAIGIMRYLHEQGIKIPEQTAIISIDGIESAEYTNPPLTTVYVPKHAMGQRAVDMIVTDTAFRGENALSILLQTHIIERASAS